MRFIR